MDISQRIIMARKNKGLSQAQLALMIGVSRGACGQWERAVTVPSVINLTRLAWTLDVHFEWLATGRGEMIYNSDIREVATANDQGKILISTEQKEMIEMYSCLPDRQKHALLSFLRTLYSKDKSS